MNDCDESKLRVLNYLRDALKIQSTANDIKVRRAPASRRRLSTDRSDSAIVIRGDGNIVGHHVICIVMNAEPPTAR